jgi:hypothetical protein
MMKNLHPLIFDLIVVDSIDEVEKLLLNFKFVLLATNYVGVDPLCKIQRFHVTVFTFVLLPEPLVNDFDCFLELEERRTLRVHVDLG